MNRRLARTLASGIAAVACAACSVITSLDGLTGGEGTDAGGDDAPVSDVAPPHPDGSHGGDDGASSGDDGASTGGDGASSGDDGASPGDGASDAGSVTDARDGSDGGWCATQGNVLYCADFDEAKQAAVYFDSVSTSNGSVTLTTATSTSPPSALLVQTNGGVQNLDVLGTKTFATIAQSKGGTFTYSYDLYVAQIDTTGNDAVLGSIQLLDSRGIYWWVYLEALWDTQQSALVPTFTQNGQFTDGGNKIASVPVSQNLPLTTWVRVTIAATFNTSGIGTGTLFFNGKQVAQMPIAVTTVNGTMGILVGISYVTPGSAGWNVRYDDVTFAAQ